MAALVGEHSLNAQPFTMATLDPLSLKLFISVAEAGTIAGAAEREHIAAAAVSKRISEIESHLGIPLLRRTNKGVELTAAGERLVTLAHRALHELDDIAVQMRDYASGETGLIRLAANVSSVVQFLPRELEAFVAQYPRIQIQLEEKSSAGVVKAVAENAADIGIFTSVPHGYEVETFPYHQDRLTLVTPSGHALARRRQIGFADTLDFEYVGLPPDTAISQQLTRAAHALARSVSDDCVGSGARRHAACGRAASGGQSRAVHRSAHRCMGRAQSADRGPVTRRITQSVRAARRALARYLSVSLCVFG
jgi:DNA-binding transcriptional LysR family regulator